MTTVRSRERPFALLLPLIAVMLPAAAALLRTRHASQDVPPWLLLNADFSKRLGRAHTEACLRNETSPPAEGQCPKVGYKRECLRSSYRPFTGVSLLRFDQCMRCCLSFWMNRLEMRGIGDAMAQAQLAAAAAAAAKPLVPAGSAAAATAGESPGRPSVSTMSLMESSTQQATAPTSHQTTGSNHISTVNGPPVDPSPFPQTQSEWDAVEYFQRGYQIADVIHWYRPLTDHEIERLRPGSLLWLGNRGGRKEFFEHTLPRLKVPVVVGVSGDHNEPFNGGCQAQTKELRPMDVDGDVRVPCPEPNYTQYLDNPNIIAFYTLNPSMRHPKVRGYAIGLKSPQGFMDASEQLDPSLSHRPNLLFCNGVIVDNTTGRTEPMPVLSEKLYEPRAWRIAHRAHVQELLLENGFACATERSDPEVWASGVFASKFIASPRGMGRADYRFWEALAAGAVPVTERDAILEEDVYKGVPAVYVGGWDEVTPEFLEKKWKAILHKAARGAYDEGMAKVHWPYWFDRLTSHLRTRLI